jgi:hypothetical protein
MATVKTTGYATAQSGALFLGRRGCEILLPLSFRWQPNIAPTQSQRRHPTMGEHFLLHPPLPSRFATPPIALPIFSRSSAVGSRFIELTD